MKLTTILKFGLLSLAGVYLSACSGVNITKWHFPYSEPVQQGNYINSQQLAELKLGMTKEQVSFLIGTPVLQSMFEQDQWHYVYQQYTNDKLNTNYTLNLKFNAASRLVAIESSGSVFKK